MDQTTGQDACTARLRSKRWSAFAAIMLLLAASAATAGTDLPTIIHFCDPGEWLIAQHGRDSLRAVFGAEEESVVVATGGALRASGAPAGHETGFAVALLDAADVDVVNIAHRDLTGDVDELRAAILAAEPSFISANLSMPDQPWRGYAVVQAGEHKVAFVGVSGRSASMDLPDSGAMPDISHIPPANAIRRTLERLGDADAVVLLTDMPIAEALSLRREFPQLAAVICSGTGGVQLAEATHGGVHLSPPGGRRAGVVSEDPAVGRVEVLAAPEEPNPRYAEALERFEYVSVTVDAMPLSAFVPARPMDALYLGQTMPLNVSAENRAVRWTVHSAAWLDSIGPARPADGRRWLVFDIEWENLLTPRVVREQELPVAYSVPTLGNHLYLVADGRRVLPIAEPREVPGLIAAGSGIMLPRQGSARRGLLVYALEADAAMEYLQFRYYDFAHGHLNATVLNAGEPGEKPETEEPLMPPAVNEVVETSVYDIEIAGELDGRRAPEGMVFVSLDLRARSMFTFEAHASAFVPLAEPGEKIEIGTVADWLEAHKYAHIVADGEYSYQPDVELTTLAADPRFLPDLMTGGRLVFMVPEDFDSLVLRGDFPNARLPSGELIRPAPIVLSLLGEPPEPPRREPIWSVEDDTIEVDITGVRAVRTFAGTDSGDGRHFVVLDVTVRTEGDKPEFFQTSRQLRYVDARGRQSAPHRATFDGPYRPAEDVWVPDGEQRTFQVAFLADGDERDPRVTYRGFTLAETVELPSLDEPVEVAVVDEPDDPPPIGIDDEDPEPVAEVDEPDDVDEPDVAEVDEPPGITGVARMHVVPEDEMEHWVWRQNREGVNVALGPLGARMESEDFPASRLPELHDGRIDRSARRLETGEYRLFLAGAGPARVNRIVFAAERWRRRLRLVVESADGQGGYERIAVIRDVELDEPHLRVLEFDPIDTEEIRLTLELTEGRWLGMAFHDIQVFEGPLADKSESVLSIGGAMISRLEYGGSVFHTHDVRSDVGHLLTPPEGRNFYARSRRRGQPAWTEPITLAFQANRTALISSIELWPADHDARRNYMPGRIRLSASLAQPFDGYEPVGEFEVTEDGSPWRLEFAEPVEARFLRVEMKTRGDMPEVSVGELVIREGTGPGYVSVMIRGDGVEWRRRQQPTLVELLGDEADKLRRIEPEALAGSAVDATMNEWIGSTVDGPNVRHVYRIDVDYDPQTEVPELQVHMAPFLRGRVRLLGAQGQEVDSPSPDDQTGTSLRYPPAIEPGEYLLEVTSAPIYLFMGFDSSGSMGRALPITHRTLPELTDNLPEGVYVALGNSQRDRETGKRFTLFSEYTNDGEALRHAMTEHKEQGNTMFVTGGGSDWYNFLRDMLEWADENTPPEAVGAKLLVADGVGAGDYGTMWDRLHLSRQRLYTVGWGSRTLRLDYVDRSTGWTAARGLFNAAWYRDGRYFEPQRDEEIVETYRAVLDDMQTPADYALRVNTRQRQAGLLATSAPEGENLPILFVLDASGSMMIELEGRTRFDVAKDVIEDMVNSLPDGSHVGLRVYGHRYRAYGAERERAAVDSELLIPVGPLNRSEFIATVRGLNARGATPLAHTIEQIPGDLRGVERPRVVVLTDGVESFRRDPVAKCRALRRRFPDMEFAVVGFMIDLMVDRENLRGMAEAGQGLYYNAMDSDSLVRSLEQALNPVIRYEVVDGQGRRAAAGRFGDSHELLQGRYTLRAAIGDGVAVLPLDIEPGLTVDIAASDLPAPSADEAPIVAETREPDEPEPAAPARFCTQCGHRLMEGARFCTQCGSPRSN